MMDGSFKYVSISWSLEAGAVSCNYYEKFTYLIAALFLIYHSYLKPDTGKKSKRKTGVKKKTLNPEFNEVC